MLVACSGKDVVSFTSYCHCSFKIALDSFVSVLLENMLCEGLELFEAKWPSGLLSCGMLLQLDTNGTKYFINKVFKFEHRAFEAC